ncbi:uncharacterized protein LOC127716083 [Mytilus californianus]|uniref:uncharacterized protein LOC127716083 n=1 Tax=Mytilus californianus TaxID=6549 RepID=UPI0022450AD9|nr:uncharacterized protein LOC127716083 [Mytilus californianus]XP_052078127.1 uncharacterized protein LOC127716083 [Mytilus californianus]
MTKSVNCCLCKKRCQLNNRRRCFSGVLKTFLTDELQRCIQETDRLCASCTAKLYKQVKNCNKTIRSRSIETNNSGEKNVADIPGACAANVFTSPKSIRLEIKSAPKTHRYCIVCKKEGNKRHRLVTITSEARTQSFIEKGIFINQKSRCCKIHMESRFFKIKALDVLQSSKQHEYFSRTDITGLLNDLRTIMKMTSSRLNFDIPALMTEENYNDLTGLSKDQFSDLLGYMSTVRSSGVRSVRTCLGVFLTKLRVGLSNKILGTVFGLKTSQVQRIIHAARRTLMETFVPHTLGFQHVSHGDFVTNHTTPVAKQLFTTDPRQAVIVLDGTYIFIQKSSDYHFQRMSYSMHKHRPLVKPMIIVGTDGYILSILGPYFADGHNNDASITKHAITNNLENITAWLQDDDICIVDRGFRDAVQYLEDQGYMVKMPVCLVKGKKQLTTNEANLTRLVTKCRWVVESTNARLKQFHFFEKVVPNTMISSIGDLVKITGGILNKYKRPLVCNPEHEEVAKKMLDRSVLQNSLQTYVEENNLIRRRTVYLPINASGTVLENFPKLTEEILRDITLGIYQLKQAPGYTREHLSESGNYELLLCKESETLLQVKIQSRHSKSTIHTLWIDYNAGSSEEKPVNGWYCTCKVGARMVGCCAHVASVLWYLGLERHMKSLKPSRLSGNTSISYAHTGTLSDNPSSTAGIEE